jgi:two-component system, LuxR family, sensor kinase FixL
MSGEDSERALVTFGVERLAEVLSAAQGAGEIPGAKSESGAVHETRFRELLEALPAAVYTTDAEGRVTFYNQAAAELWGYRPPLGKTEWCGSWRLYSPDGTPMPHDQCPMAVVLKENRMVRGVEAVAERPDGTRIPVLPFPTPLRDTSGAIVGAVNMVVDVTDRKRAEERERELQAELLHVSRLAAMGQIASIIAHELNQPLAAVVNYVEGCRSLLESSEITDAGLIRDALAQVSQQALHAGQILRRVRGFIGRRSCERERVNIADLLHQASTLAIVGAKPNSSTVSVRSNGAPQFVVGDKTQLQQVVFNLVRNAVEAMQESEQRELLLATASSENNMVEVSIADTGPGIDEEIRSQLFEPFVTTKRNGMGIGLSLCRTIIEAHGGQLWAEPSPNGGTVFRFTLPAISDVE